MKLLTVAILCVFLFKPANVVNSQKLDDPLIKQINDKETENVLLRQKIKSNRNEIDLLINQWREVKNESKPVKKSFYKKIFRSKKRLPDIAKGPKVNVRKIDSIKVDSLTIEIRVLNPVPKKESFFKRIFKIFKHER